VLSRLWPLFAIVTLAALALKQPPAAAAKNASGPAQ
jgi:hypothetical protein